MISTYLQITCLFVMLLSGCKQQSVKLSQDVKTSEIFPTENVEVKADTDISVESVSYDIFVPTYQYPLEVIPGKPSIIEGRNSIGKYQLVDGCLLFVDINTGQIGTAILPRGSLLSYEPFMLHIAGDEIALNQQTTVAGVIRENRSLEDWSIHPPIPPSCPSSSIIIGVKHDKLK